MMESELNRWNKQQKKLRAHLADPASHLEAVDLFLKQHAAVHSAEMSSIDVISFEDEITFDLDDMHLREIPAQMEHSIAWILWHLARIEDVTMNILVAGGDQVIISDDWVKRLHCSVLHTGNSMAKKDVFALSASVNVGALKKYRLAVGQQTEKLVKSLKPGDLGQKVSSARLERLIPEGAVAEESRGLIDYWSRRDITGLLLMPPTRHCIVHLNEATKIKKRIMV